MLNRQCFYSFFILELCHFDLDDLSVIAEYLPRHCFSHITPFYKALSACNRHDLAKAVNTTFGCGAWTFFAPDTAFNMFIVKPAASSINCDALIHIHF